MKRNYKCNKLNFMKLIRKFNKFQYKIKTSKNCKIWQNYINKLINYYKIKKMIFKISLNRKKNSIKLIFSKFRQIKLIISKNID